MGRKTWKISMTDQQRELLDSWVRAKTTPQRVAFRAKICLLAADGMSATDIAQQMGTTRPTVLLWRRRFEDQGPVGLTKDAPRGPSPRRLDEQTRQAIVDATLNSTPPDSSQWTTRTLAKALGVSNATVARIWKTLKITPRKKSSKPQKEERSKTGRMELVGVYLTPALKAFVISSDRLFSPPTGIPELQPANYGSIGCSSCLSDAIAAIERAGSICPDERPGLPEGIEFLRRATDSTGDDYYIFLEDRDHIAHLLVQRWANRPVRSHIHIFPDGYFNYNNLRQTVFDVIGARLAETRDSSGFLDRIEKTVLNYDGRSTPFIWMKRAEISRSNQAVCKVMLETIRSMATFIMKLNRSEMNDGHGAGEELMNWKQKLESWFAAVAFAEENDHNAALRIAENPVPETEPVRIIPTFSPAFAAAAFAEENCHVYAREMMYGVVRTNSFLAAIGLERVRVWYGTACTEESFAEAIGLVGVRYKLMTIEI